MCEMPSLPCSKIFLEKLLVAQLVKKFPASYGTSRFSNILTTANHWSVFSLSTESPYLSKNHFKINLSKAASSFRVYRLKLFMHPKELENSSIMKFPVLVVSYSSFISFGGMQCIYVNK